MKRRALYAWVLILFLSGLPSYAPAIGTTATHVVKIKSNPLAVMSLAGTGGRNWTRLVVDKTGITTENQELKWTTNLEDMKVTVQSNLARDKQDYILRVRAVNLNSNGISKGWVVVGERPSNLITGIALETGGCSLGYQAAPKISEKPGHDEHIITYTITE